MTKNKKEIIAQSVDVKGKNTTSTVVTHTEKKHIFAPTTHTYETTTTVTKQGFFGPSSKSSVTKSKTAPS